MGSSEDYIAMVDYSNTNNIYIGEAVPGSATSDQVWRIQMVTIVVGTVGILWADGTNAFDKIWNNRKMYTYS